MRSAQVFLVTLLLAGPASAQAERYELGRRLKAFERAWDATPDEAKRKVALAILPKATTQFFSLQLGEAGRTLDEAAFALWAEPPTNTQRLLASLMAVPEVRLVDADRKTVTVEVKAFYKLPNGPPAGATVLVGFGDPLRPVPLDKLPAKITLSFPTRKPTDPFPNTSEGDWTLWVQCQGAKETLLRAGPPVSRVRDLAGRLAELAAVRKGIRGRSAAGWDKSPVGIELATLHDLAEFVAETADGEVPETDRPIARLLDDAGRVAQLAAAGEPYLTPARPGDFAVSFPVEPKRSLAARLFVPKGLKPDRPVPLVVALHGSGASENMFFEGYGNGRVVQECEKRGWLLVSPRVEIRLGRMPPVNVVIEQIAARYPVDRRRVFVVGHSMGASTALTACKNFPGLFAGAAMLGGGGLLKDPTPFAALPTFVGVGDKDFAVQASRALAKSLAGTPTEFKEYPGVEHLAIVGLALPDVFAAWDKLAK